MRWNMETVFIILAVCFCNLACFLAGANAGRTVTKVETKVEAEKPTVNPMKAFKEHKAQKEAKKELDKIETILANIENYDGTGNNQEDVPGR
jgi:hypothetical protein